MRRGRAIDRDGGGRGSSRIRRRCLTPGAGPAGAGSPAGPRVAAL